MKTLHLYLIAIAATLAACSSDEAVAPATGGDVGDDLISFTTNIANVTSRGGIGKDVDSLQANGFWVKALRIDGTSLWPNTETGDMLHFAYNSETSTFLPEVPENATFSAKWPTGQTVFLYASNINPTTQKITKLNAANEDVYAGQVYTNLEPGSDITQHSDIIYATNYGMRSDFTNGTIPLYFKHSLCQIEVQAKNDNPDYTVKVKGYMLHFPAVIGTLAFPMPQQYKFVTTTSNGVTTTNPSTTVPDCSWVNLLHDSSLNYYVDFKSGYVNDFTTSGTGIYDEGDANHITLTADPQKISNGTDQGYAYIIPNGPYAADLASGSCIYLIVQIDYNNYANGDKTATPTKTPLFPACRKTASETDNNLSTRVSYSGLPKYYGRVYVPYSFTADWLTYAGKKVTFILDFSNGLGYVDRHLPSVVDATDSNYNADTGTGTALTGVDPYSAYNLVLGSDIGVTAVVSDLTNLEQTPATN